MESNAVPMVSKVTEYMFHAHCRIHLSYDVLTIRIPEDIETHMFSQLVSQTYKKYEQIEQASLIFV